MSYASHRELQVSAASGGLSEVNWHSQVRHYAPQKTGCLRLEPAWRPGPLAGLQGQQAGRQAPRRTVQSPRPRSTAAGPRGAAGNTRARAPPALPDWRSPLCRLPRRRTAAAWLPGRSVLSRPEGPEPAGAAVPLQRHAHPLPASPRLYPASERLRRPVLAPRMGAAPRLPRSEAGRRSASGLRPAGGRHTSCCVGDSRARSQGLRGGRAALLQPWVHHGCSRAWWSATLRRSQPGWRVRGARTRMSVLGLFNAISDSSTPSATAQLQFIGG